MPRARTPSYRRQEYPKKKGEPKRSPLAFVELNGKRHYLGEYGAPESRQQYDRLIAEWLSNGRRAERDGHLRSTPVRAAWHAALRPKRVEERNIKP